MTLPMPEFEHLQSCANCGHPRAKHYRGVEGCLTNAQNLIDARWCPCTAYQPSEEL